jgi:hypothetical protein
MRSGPLNSLLVAVLILTGGLRASAADAPSIWGKRILGQPFDKVEFREINIPAWVEDTTGVGYTLSGQDEEHRQAFIKAGVTISELGFVDPFFVYYDSKLLKKRSPHVPPDQVDKEVANYRRLGLRILGVVPPSLQSEIYADHPDWRRVSDKSGEVPNVDLEKNPAGGMLCLLGPYGNYLNDLLAEITEKYRVDAWSFDGLHYAGVCYCEHCRRDFKKETGGDIPAVNLNDPAFRRYQHWADRRMEDLIRRMQVRLKGINPECALVTWTTNAGRFGHFRDIPRNMPARMNLLLDAPDQEFWLDETNRGATVVPAIANAYIWACTNHRVAFSEPYLMSHGNPYGKDSFPRHEVVRRMMLACTHGASPSLAVRQPDFLQPGADAGLEALKARKPWLTHKSPEPWGAIVLSDNTRVLYGRDPGLVEDRYLAHVFGTFRAVLEDHLPVTLICDWNLCDEDLSKYKVLILPNTACLDDAQVAAIRKYVQNGGGLLASLDTSMCNEFGDVRPDFALSDVLGVHPAGRAQNSSAKEELDVNFAKNLDPAYWLNRKNAFSLYVPADSPLSSPKLRELIGLDQVVFKGPNLNVTPVEVDPAKPAGSPLTLAATSVPFSDGQAERKPAITTRLYGKGRVVYFAAGLDHGYYSYSYPFERVLLTNAMKWAANCPPPVEVAAPMCVHATAFRQNKDGERLLVHLFNDVNTTAFHALPTDDVPLREETIPIHDIVISVRGTNVKSATQQPEDKPLDVQVDGDVTKITVPVLDVHSIVVIEPDHS